MQRNEINSYTENMQKLLENQYRNLFMWSGLLMALGAGLYFALPFEPKLIFPTAVTILLAVLALVPRVHLLLRGLILFVFGFCYAYSYTHITDTPTLKHDMRDTIITANVVNIDTANNKTRLYLNTDDDVNIRVSLTDGVPIPSLGDRVSATATLYRPSAAYAPETFDYARWAYFNGLTATGYVTDITILDSGDASVINKIRDNLHRESNSFLVDALVLGYKNSVPENESKIWTATGVGHVWSISGFHMTLVGGWLFAVFFLIFRSVPYITRRIPARIPAMAFAWLGLLGYLFLSGCDVATVRAFLMTTLVFMAFIFGRTAVSLRNICLAMLVVFLINPHYVMQPGFQLSFSAVFGLVWFWGDVQYKPRTFFQKILRIIYITIMTSVVATVFTAPFVIAHFGALPLFGVVGNLILLPVFSFAIMPLVILGTFGVPFATEWAHIIYEKLFVVAQTISGLPYATIQMPHISNLVIILCILGLACLIFIRPIRVKINYILCGIFITTGITLYTLSPRPVFMTSADNELVAMYDGDSNLLFNKSRSSKHYFAFDTWKQYVGISPDTPTTKQKCHRNICEFEHNGIRLVQTNRFMPLMKNLNKWCTNKDTDFIVSNFEIDAPACQHKILPRGSVVYENGTVRQTTTNRYWHNRRR